MSIKQKPHRNRDKRRALRSHVRDVLQKNYGVLYTPLVVRLLICHFREVSLADGIHFGGRCRCGEVTAAERLK